MDDIKPINITKDGNCLFNTAIIATFKSATLAVELRLHTALGLLTNAISSDHIPLSPLWISPLCTETGGPKEGIYDTLILSNTAVRVHAREGFQRPLQHEMYNTLCN